uniref:hypothetical protein n=1 Tax=uncultured Draconibacterium sp. TaxID=1573823 RepID=UPI003217BC0C
MKKNLFVIVLLLALFGCSKNDEIKNTSLTINLNPGQGLTVSELDGLTIGIVRLPDGTTKNDDLDNLQWTSEPEWILGTSNNEGEIVFNTIDAGLYLVQMNNDSMLFETFFEDVTNVYVQVNNNERTNKPINVVLKEANNNYFSSDQYSWSTKEDADNAWTLKAHCYNENNTKTETIQIEAVYQKSSIVETFLMGYIFGTTIEDMYYIKGLHHNLRDKYHKIEIEILNNNDGSTVSKTIYPASKTWVAKKYIEEEEITIGNNKLLLNCSYENVLGNDHLIITACGLRN